MLVVNVLVQVIAKKDQPALIILVHRLRETLSTELQMVLV